jgi:2,4-dienoyl-CoA reductase-like NADH-dependent reductase (Old Yellow Enzyme family)
VVPGGRITAADLGVWDDAHVPELARCARFIRGQGAAAGIQLAHAGRKASTTPPWEGGRQVPPDSGGWPTVAPSAVPFRPGDVAPEALGHDGIAAIVDAFAAAARRADAAGFQVIEVHAAHGYLLHQFLSPLSNRRDDDYGGSLENRMRLTLEVTRAVRRVWPADRPLFVRISATDWADDGWDLDQSVVLAGRLADEGVELVDCSSGGLVPGVSIPLGPGYQLEFAERIRREAKVMTGAVGLITEPQQANAVVASGQADLVFLARQLLRHPYWPLRAARTLGAAIAWPKQYERAAD